MGTKLLRNGVNKLSATFFKYLSTLEERIECFDIDEKDKLTLP